MNIDKYSFEYCKKLASECSSRTDFSKRYNFAYKISCKNNWIKFLIPSKKRELTYNKCKEIAKRFKTRIDFLKYDESMYRVCQYNKWLDDFFGKQKINRTKDSTIYDYDTCKNLANSCKTKHEMKEKYSRAYIISLKNKWLDDFFNENKRNLTYEFCKEVASKCSSRKELNIKDVSVYCKSLKMGWLDEFYLEKEYSVLEREVMNYCKNNFISYKYRAKCFEWLKNKNKLELDFYLPDYNTAIECQGIQHFEPRDYFGGEDEYKGIIKRDCKKKKLCDKYNIRLFYYTKNNYENIKIYNKENTYTNIDLLFEAIYSLK